MTGRPVQRVRYGAPASCAFLSTSRTSERRLWDPWRTLDEDLAGAIDAGCRDAGGYRPAARRIGITPGYLWLLAHGQRRPSTVVAELLIGGLGLDSAAARGLRAVAAADAGRASPHRKV